MLLVRNRLRFFWGFTSKGFRTSTSLPKSRQSKKLFWHIDYFLANKDTEIIKIEKKNISECDLNKKTIGKSIVCGFGSSDCINNCKSHLIYKPNRPHHNLI